MEENARNRKRYRRFLIGLLILHLFGCAVFTYNYLKKNIPNTISMDTNHQAQIDMKVPLDAYVEAGLYSTQSLDDTLVLKASETGNYKITFKLFGLLNVKTVDVNVVEPQEIIPCGIPIGLYLQTEGVMVIGTGKFTDAMGSTVEPSYGIVQSGDYIRSINGIEVSSKSQLAFLINKYGDEDVILGLRRNKEEIEVKISPSLNSAKQYCLGIWVRDDTQGIGTLTYIDKNNNFGALGHGISDVDTGQLLDSNDGLLYQAKIWGIKKGQLGTPGGLCGSIEYENKNILGNITCNSEQGIYGEANDVLVEQCNFEALPIAFKQEIKEGTAYIRCDVGDGRRDYEIRIEKINVNTSDSNRGIVLTVVDEKLLDKTNGIVQGMSGSPIIQDGKIIGAVTHVLVNDPTRGYGIFIESMLEHN